VAGKANAGMLFSCFFSFVDKGVGVQVKLCDPERSVMRCVRCPLPLPLPLVFHLLKCSLVFDPWFNLCQKRIGPVSSVKTAL